MSFYKDLAIGRISELFVLQYIRMRDADADIVKGKHSAYDINAPTLELTYEVKGDYESQTYNNIVVEVEHPIGNPSGLRVTTADYWVHDTGRELIWIAVDEIWKCIIQVKHKTKVWTGPGDQYPKRASLVPIHLYRIYAFKCVPYTLETMIRMLDGIIPEDQLIHAQRHYRHKKSADA